MKHNINFVEVHPQLNHNGHLMDGMLVCASSFWPRYWEPQGFQVPIEKITKQLCCPHYDGLTMLNSLLKKYNNNASELPIKYLIGETNLFFQV